MSKPTKPNKKSLPDYVFPLGVRFTVVPLATIPDEELGDNDMTFGDMSLDRKRIRVVDTQDSGRRWSTLYHEYVHATFGLVGIDDALDGVDGLEEIIVRAVETTTEQFLLAHGDQWMEALRAQKGDEE